MSRRAYILALQLSLLSGPMAAQGGAPRCDRGPGRGLLTGLRQALPYDAGRTSAAIDSVLLNLGYQIDKGAPRPGSWVTMPRFRWPTGTERDSWHGDRNPGVQLLVYATAKGDSTLLDVAARVVCVLDSAEQDGRPGSAAETLKVTAAMQVISEVTAYLKKRP